MGGFGRFGRLHEDGLLTLNVTPNSLATANIGPGLGLEWDKAKSIKVIEIDGTKKTLALMGDSPGVRRLEWSLLYPGFELTLDSGAELEISDGRGGKVSTRSRFKGGSLVISRDDQLSPPLQIVSVTPGTKQVVDKEKIVFSGPSEIRLRVVTPLGVTPEVKRQGELAREVARWERIAVPRLVSLEPTEGGERASFSGSSISPVPPIWGFAAGLEKPPRLLAGPDTRVGPFLYVQGESVDIDLPRYINYSRGLIAPERVSSSDQRFLSGFVIDPEMAWAKNAVDLGFSRRVPVLLAGSGVLPQQREQMIRFLRQGLLKTFRSAEPVWNQATEPFTGLSYVWTFGLPGPGGFSYDLEWGNMLPVYGLYQYALASGDWDFVRELWPGVRQALRFFLIGQDWAWMTGVNAEHGHSTGTGDPLNAAYVGMIAAAEMAKQIGFHEESTRYQWIVRRMSIPTAARLILTPWARDRGFVAPERIVLGLHETEGFTRAPLPGGDPWYPHSLFSGNGMFPELFALYAAHEPQGLEHTIKILEQAYPKWQDADYQYPFRTTYGGNSVYAVFPQVYARFFAPNLKPSRSQAMDWMRSIARNKVHAWVGANVVTEAWGSERGIWLTAWRPAGLESARWRGNEAVIRLKVNQGQTVPVRWREEGKWVVTGATSEFGVSVTQRVSGVDLTSTRTKTITLRLKTDLIR